MYYVQKCSGRHFEGDKTQAIIWSTAIYFMLSGLNIAEEIVGSIPEYELILGS